MFYENTINFTEYHKQPDGSYTYGDNVGTEPHGWHAVGDIGLAAAGARSLLCVVRFFNCYFMRVSRGVGCCIQRSGTIISKNDRSDMPGRVISFLLCTGKK
jgi:hypothetical protein